MSNSHDPLKNSSGEVKQYFTLDTAEHQAMRIDDFLEKRPQFTEKDKINYLLNSIRTSTAIFLRNGNSYEGSKAARWLGWKMYHKQYWDNPIRTGWDFVNRVADGSRKTGQPYQLILQTGEHVDLQEVLRDELNRLEEQIAEREETERLMKESIAPDGAPLKAGETDVLPPPMLTPSPR